MKILKISAVETAEETLITYKGKNFMVKNMSCGQYAFERRVNIYKVEDDLAKVFLKHVGVLKLFSKDAIEKESLTSQCLVIGHTDYNTCLESAMRYIKSSIDFFTK